MGKTIEGPAGREARHDPGLGREQPDRPGDRRQGRAVRGDPGPHPGHRRLLRRPDRVRRHRPAQGQQAAGAGTSPRPGSRRAATCVELRTDDAASTRSARSSRPSVFEAGQHRRRRRHQQGQGLRRCDEAARLQRPGRRPRRRSASTARRARSAPAPPRAACSRACGWPAGWAATRTTTQNLTVHAVDAERGLLLIKGAVPGPTRRPRRSSAPPRRELRDDVDHRATSLDA